MLYSVFLDVPSYDCKRMVRTLDPLAMDSVVGLVGCPSSVHCHSFTASLASFVCRLWNPVSWVNPSMRYRPF